MYIFSQKSRENLFGVHADLVIVAATALAYTEVDFGVTEGLRTKERQRILVESGASKTMSSRHLTGHAIDIVAYDKDGKQSWAWAYYEYLGDLLLSVAEDLKIPLDWGGHWKTFVDGPHFELPREVYR